MQLKFLIEASDNDLDLAVEYVNNIRVDGEFDKEQVVQELKRFRRHIDGLQKLPQKQQLEQPKKLFNLSVVTQNFAESILNPIYNFPIFCDNQCLRKKFFKTEINKKLFKINGE